MITQDELKRLFHYNPETGLFTRLVRTANRTYVGQIAGGINSQGYISIEINRKSYKAHRLAFLYMTGIIPDEVDHINLIRSDTRWVNLREATRSENQQNRRKPMITNTSKLLGAHIDKRSPNKFYSEIRIDGERINLGSFNTAKEAHEAYINKKREIHPFNTL
jgi:hypothetical protein